MSGQNYIGSKISLVSLSDIRYVGILHNINPVESTVALQNVKSYGTEGRKDNPSEEIPPSDNTFDYVVFRGSDIKDLQVFEAPPSFQSEQTQKPVQQPKPAAAEPVNAAPYNYPPSNMASYYSASNMFSNGKDSSVDYGTTYGAASNYWQGNGNGPAAAYNPYIQQPRYQMPVPENYQAVPSAPPAAAISDLNMNENGVSPPSKKEYKPEEEKTVVSPKKEGTAVSLTSTSMQAKASQEKEEVAPPAIEQADEALLDSLVKQVSDLDIKQPSFVNKQKLPVKQQKQQLQQNQVNNGNHARVGGGSNSSGNYGNRGRRNSARNLTKNNSTRRNGNVGNAWEPNNVNGNHSANNGQRGSSVHRRNSGIVIPKSDFDFESSNSKFEKHGINTIEDGRQAKEENIVIIPEADHFYDKKKSFFDDISCESKEYQKGSNRGGKYKEESMLNLETFGQANPAGQNGKRSRHRGIRGGRGRQQRSGRGKASAAAGAVNSIGQEA